MPSVSDGGVHGDSSNVVLEAHLLSLLSSARRLPQSRNQWQLAVKRLRLWLLNDDNQPVRPPCMLLLDLYPSGALRAHRFTPAATATGTLPTPREVLQFLVEEMLTPQREQRERRRPASISFVDGALATALAKPLSYVLGAPDDWVPPVLSEADGVRDFMVRFAEKLVAQGKGTSSPAAEQPGLVDAVRERGHSAAAIALVARYFRAAAAWYRRAPWTRIPDRWLFRVETPTDSGGHSFQTFFVAILGGRTPGLVAMPSVRGARKRYQASVKGADATADAADDIPDTVFCAYTGQVLPGPYAWRCSRCHAAYYLDESAQRADWRRHAPECDRIVAAREPATAASTADTLRIQRPFWCQVELVHMYMEESALPFDDLDAIGEHQWPIAEPPGASWPVPFVTRSGPALLQPKVERPTRHQLEWLTDMLEWMLADGHLECMVGKCPAITETSARVSFVEDMACREARH